MFDSIWRRKPRKGRKQPLRQFLPRLYSGNIDLNVADGVSPDDAQEALQQQTAANKPGLSRRRQGGPANSIEEILSSSRDVEKAKETLSLMHNNSSNVSTDDADTNLPSGNLHASVFLACIYLLAYLSTAIIIYSFALEPDWTAVDSLYFAVNLLTTLGRGNQEPSTPAGQVCAILFSIFGGVLFGVLVGIARQQQQQKFMFNMDIQSKLSGDQHRRRRKKQATWCARLSEYLSTVTNDVQILVKDIRSVLWEDAPKIATLFVLAIPLGYREGWSPLDLLYFFVMSASTTGFGDFVATSQLGKLYCVIWLPLAAVGFGETLFKIAARYLQQRQRLHERKLLKRVLAVCDPQQVTTMEDFLGVVLTALQRVDAQDLQDIQAAFQSLERRRHIARRRGNTKVATHDSSHNST